MSRILFKLFSLVILWGMLFTPITNAYYSDNETSQANTFSAGCWSPPSVPDLAGPAAGSYTNQVEVTLNWSDSDFACPGQAVEYLYELNGVESAWQTDTAINLALTEGVYRWRVKARTEAQESAFSAAWTVTVDRTPPMTTLSFKGKSINEKVLNGDFESGIANWERQGQVLIQTADDYADPKSGTYMARIGHIADDGNEIWENRLRQRIQPGAKNLSFYYNFFSFDYATFDDPGMVVRLNDYNVFYLSAGDIDSGGPTPNESGWRQLSFDISQIPDPVLEIVFYSGNTGDTGQQSWVYIDQISTAEAVAEGGVNFILTADEPAQTYYGLDGSFPVTAGNSFSSKLLIGDQVNYYSLDLAGNMESLNSRRVVKDSDAPAAIDDLEAMAISKQSVNLTWTVPEDITVYDIRYSLDPITELNFNGAVSVPNPPAPRIAGNDQDFEVTGLNSGTVYYFVVKSGDAALNWSALSNVVSATTLDEIEEPDLNPGDVVINELMWMGSLGNGDDEWLELRNLTDQEISLTNWTVAGVIIPDGKTLPAQGYFLISNFDKAGSKINVDPDLVDGSLVLNNLDAQYILKDNLGNIIDTADNEEGAPAAGEYDSANNIYYSMERDATPGNGYDANVWHTSFTDPVSLSGYWDAGFVEKGTPGGQNLSQAPKPVGTELKLVYANHNAGFTVTNISRFNQLKYTLIYDSDAGPQGITGTVEINNQTDIEVKDLVLGTCSAGGTCVYHQGVEQINLNVELSGVINRGLTQTLAL